MTMSKGVVVPPGGGKHLDMTGQFVIVSGDAQQCRVHGSRGHFHRHRPNTVSLFAILFG